MTGFDRPLKPEWIYQFIQTVKIGDKFFDHKPEFNKIIWELEGKDGKRKVGTVLTRYFLKKEDNPKSKTVEKTLIYNIVKGKALEDVKPLLLFQILARSKTLRIITNIIYELYGDHQDINYKFLRKKIIEKFGGREITSRTLRNFLRTLVDFGLLEKKNGIYKWKDKFDVTETNLCYMLKLYAEEYKKSPQIIFHELEDYLFIFFNLPDINEIAKKYNKILWDYSYNVNKRQIMFSNVYDWNQILEH